MPARVNVRINEFVGQNIELGSVIRHNDVPIGIVVGVDNESDMVTVQINGHTHLDSQAADVAQRMIEEGLNNPISMGCKVVEKPQGKMIKIGSHEDRLKVLGVFDEDNQ